MTSSGPSSVVGASEKLERATLGRRGGLDETWLFLFFFGCVALIRFVMLER